MFRAGTRATAEYRVDPRRARILVADRDKQSRRTLREYLEQNGYEVTTASSGVSLEQRWRTTRPDLAILDSALPDCNMATLIPKLRAGDPFIPLIVLARPDALGFAMAALRMGAEQFLPKPLDVRIVAAVIERNLEHQRLRRKHSAEQLSQQNLDPFIGQSDAIRCLADLAKKAALSDSPAVIEGERGTGKRLLASWLHENGPRASHPFIEFSCGSLLRSGTEGEDKIGLFDRQRQHLAGLPAVVRGGTIVLAEIQSIDFKTQAKLLRMLGKQSSAGSAHSRSTWDIRLLSTTQESLAELVQAKRLRGDLYSRISGFTLRIPPLRERLGDLPMLAVQILGSVACQLGNRDFGLTRRALQVLQDYDWPGNIRELRIVLDRAALLARSSSLTAADLHLGAQSEGDVASRLQLRTLRETERQYVEHVLQTVGGRVQIAAKILDVPRSSLYHKLKQYQFERTGMKSAS
jgi:DNA-binding NtrC family response regulator